jgi:hypothetical protein
MLNNLRFRSFFARGSRTSRELNSYNKLFHPLPASKLKPEE